MAKILRVSITGDMPGGEVWSVNPVFAIGGDFGAPVSAAQAAAVAAAIDGITVSAGITAMFTSGTGITGCRVEARALDGTLETLAEHVRGARVPGIATSTSGYQAAMVSSLRTSVPGASGRGRLYWPANGIPLQLTNYRPTSANMNTYTAGVRSYLNSILAAIDVTFDGVSLCVWSRKNASTANVTSIQLGDVLDTQRRRRDAEIENYTVLPFPS